MNKTDVIIVGAGAAGLMAASELGKVGKRVIILEARDRVGGRIRSLPKEIFGYEAQAGAEFVHGPAPITRAVIKEAGLSLTFLTEWWSVRDGKPTKYQDDYPYKSLLKEKLKSLKEDISITKFLDNYFKDKEYTSLRNSVLLRIEGYEAADPNRASSFALREDLLDGNSWQQMNIKEGYGSLVQFLENKCRGNGVEICLRKEVKSIKVLKGGVSADCKDGTSYIATRIIVTIPPVLFEDILFNPLLPSKIGAALNIGFGSAIKILIRFKTKWWAGAREKNFEKLFFMFSNEEIPTWWTQYPEPYTTLTGWVAGPSAEKLSHCSDADLVKKALISLSNIFKISTSELEKEVIISRVINWPADHLTRGAYTYWTPESSSCVAELLKPVDNKIFFAGEAVYQGEEIGTVEAALASGKGAAHQILNLG